MFNHSSSFFSRRLAVLTVCTSLMAQGTIFSAAFAAGGAPTSEKAGDAQIYVLPADREQSPETMGLCTKALEEGRKAYEKNEFDKAITKFQEAYGLAREIKFNDAEGQALTEMCSYYLNKGQVPRAKMLGENAIEVLADSSDKKSLGQARAALARVYLMQDNTYMAMQQLEEAMKLFTELGANDSSEAAKVLVLAADMGLRTGHTKEALLCYEAAASYNGQAGESNSQVALQVRVASSLLSLGFSTAALEEAQKALGVARSTNKPDQLVSALACVANCQYCLCEFPEARKTYEELLQIKVPNQSALDRAVILEAYGFSLAATGDYDQAKLNLEKALPILKTQGAVLHRAQTYNAIGVMNASQGNYPAAMQNLKNALEAVSVCNPKQEKLAISIMQNLATVQSRAGENRNAQQQLSNTVRACSSKQYQNPMQEGRCYAALAEVLLNLKEYTEAEAVIKNGIAVSQRINDDAALWRLYTCLARVQLATQQPATDSLTSAVSFFRSPQAGDFATPMEMTYPTRRDEMGEELVSLLVSNGLVEQGLLAAEQLKEEQFINDWHRKGGEVRASDRDIYLDMVTRRNHLHAAESSGLPQMVMKEWRDWLNRFQHIAAENPTLARLIAPVPINLPEVTKLIQTNHAAIVDYLVGAHSTTMFIIDSNRHLSAIKLAVGKEELQPQVASLLTASAKADESARATEHRLLQLLYNELLPEDAIKLLPPNADNTVVVIPDSILYNVPFAALLANSGKYLVESHTLTMAPSLTVLMDAPHPSKDLSVVMASDKTGEETESGQISSIFDPTQVVRLAGKDVEMNNLQEQAKSTSIIHFSAAVPIPQGNPLRSVLTLGSQDKGKMTANGLFDLNLPNDLAVLSASSVNAKDFKGNGVQVFSRGFNYAGVRNVLMSLWVEPEAERTSELLEFYRSRQKGLNQAQSLRKAQLLGLSKDPSPRLWAAFQLLGPGF